MRKATISSLVAFVACAVVSSGASADLVTVPYTGTYDEATGLEAAGDYDNIGGAMDVGVFDLLPGNNVFVGSARTPADSSDFFAIRIGPGQTLVGASLTWGTNLDFSNYLFASPSPIWTLEESSVTPTIFLVDPLSPSYSTAPETFTAPSFSRGEGVYGMTLGNGTFARYDNSAVGYSMTFVVEAAPVPEPAAFALLGAGLAILGFARLNKRAE